MIRRLAAGDSSSISSSMGGGSEVAGAHLAHRGRAGAAHGVGTRGGDVRERVEACLAHAHLPRALLVAPLLRRHEEVVLQPRALPAEDVATVAAVVLAPVLVEALVALLAVCHAGVRHPARFVHHRVHGGGHGRGPAGPRPVCSPSEGLEITRRDHHGGTHIARPNDDA